MDFELSPTAERLCDELLDFMDRHVYPAEAVYREQMEAAGRSARPPAGHRGPEGGGPPPGAVEPVHAPSHPVDRAGQQPGLRPAGRDQRAERPWRRRP